MKKIAKLELKQLNELTKSGKTVLEFSASWCPDCRFLDPFMPEIEQDFADSNFYQIDSDGSGQVTKELSVMGIPSFVVFEDGKEIGRLVNKNRKTKAEVEEFLKPLVG